MSSVCYGFLRKYRSETPGKPRPHRRHVGGRDLVFRNGRDVARKHGNVRQFARTPGAEITIEARGEDEGEALNALAELVTGRFGEEPY